MREFDLIHRYFGGRGHKRKDVNLGIGDDCAVVTVPEGQSLAVTTDALLEGVHFIKNADPGDIAHKALAVNLSDLASMGAEPAWISLALSLPEVNDAWLQKFSQTLFELTDYYSVQLVGGDTVRGPLAVTITAQGLVPQDTALTRSGAQPGDWIFVTGHPGDAGVGLDILTGKRQFATADSKYFLTRHRRPTPRVMAGTVLRRNATACIDVSDGLLADLQHLLDASGCGAKVQVDQLPLSPAMGRCLDSNSGFEYALASGDDYELLFTVSEENKGNLKVALAHANVQATCIGQINSNAGKLSLKFEDEPYHFERRGYEHF